MVSRVRKAKVSCPVGQVYKLQHSNGSPFLFQVSWDFLHSWPSPLRLSYQLTCPFLTSREVDRRKQHLSGSTQFPAKRKRGRKPGKWSRKGRERKRDTAKESVAGVAQHSPAWTRCRVLPQVKAKPQPSLGDVCNSLQLGLPPFHDEVFRERNKK